LVGAFVEVLLLAGVGEGVGEAHFCFAAPQEKGHPPPLSSARSVEAVMERPVRRTPAKERRRSEESFIREKYCFEVKGDYFPSLPEQSVQRSQTCMRSRCSNFFHTASERRLSRYFF
jgi:hypothetical protein